MTSGPVAGGGEHGRLSRPGRSGFSLIEMLLVVVILGILVVVAIPNYRAMSLRARAVDLQSRVRTVSQAAHEHQAETFVWPAEAGPGEVPPELDDNLPDGFAFTGEDFVLDWDNLALPGGLPDDPGTTRLIAVTVRVDDDRLGRALVDVFGPRRWFNVGERYTFLIER